jgi:hypothetical protein
LGQPGAAGASPNLFIQAMILHIPENAKTFELTNSIFWFNEDGILYSLPKEKITELNEQEILKEMEAFRKIIGNQKVCMIAEAHPKGSKPPAKEQRESIAKEISSVTKAMAVLTSSSLSRMIINLFFGFKPPDYPVRMCKTEQEAKEWIKKYL